MCGLSVKSCYLLVLSGLRESMEEEYPCRLYSNRRSSKKATLPKLRRAEGPYLTQKPCYSAIPHTRRACTEAPDLNLTQAQAAKIIGCNGMMGGLLGAWAHQSERLGIGPESWDSTRFP
jgi:hypothetical protein